MLPALRLPNPRQGLCLAGRLQNNAHIPKNRHYGSQQQNRQCEARVTVGQLLRCSLAAMLQEAKGCSNRDCQAATAAKAAAAKALSPLHKQEYLCHAPCISLPSNHLYLFLRVARLPHWLVNYVHCNDIGGRQLQRWASTSSRSNSSISSADAAGVGCGKTP